MRAEMGGGGGSKEAAEVRRGRMLPPKGGNLQLIRDRICFKLSVSPPCISF